MKTNSPRRHSAALIASALVLLGLASTGAQALPTINLTGDAYNGTAVNGVNSVTGTVGGSITTNLGTVIFARNNTQPAGTGVFNPFLRLDCKGNGCDEQGYNTNGVKGDASNGYTTRKILDNMSPVNWTHDVLLSDLRLDATEKYYEFKLDINEPGATGKSLLSLDGLRLYSTSEPGQFGQGVDDNPLTGITNEWVGPTQATSKLLWDLDGTPQYKPEPGQGGWTNDRSILLDYNVSGGGSGVADMVMLVSREVIDAAKTRSLVDGQKNLILWSRFGLDQDAKADQSADPTLASAGFEEWSYSMQKGGTPNTPGGGVPTPGSAPLAALALAILAFNYRSRKAATS